MRRDLLVVAVVLIVAGGGSACGDEVEPEPQPEPVAEADPEVASEDHSAEPRDDSHRGERSHTPPREDKPSGPAESGDEDPRQTALERRAERTVRSFVAALDAREGAQACALLVSDALDQVDLPETRGSCAASLEASIGYRDPRGLPVWESAELSAVRSVELDGSGARVVATTLTRFADREQISIEDDVIYLTRDGAGWLIAKPSSTLYRAVGVADVPPSVLSPPSG